MKRGFTLVELLAVIVILAIILVIAVPGISGIIESTQVSAFRSDEQLLAKAAKTYASINSNYLPVNTGETKEITLNELQSNDFISAIKDPKNSSNLCNGYVLITKLDDGNYSYNPHLNCVNNISNSTDDGLLAHYTFDDFQETTQNYVLNGDVKTLQYWNAANDTGAGDNITKTLITNDGVDDNYSVEYNVIARPSWGYEYHSLRDYIPAGWFSTTSKYTLSFWAKKINGSGSIDVFIHDGTSNNKVMDEKDFTLTSDWKRYEFTFTPLSSGNQPVIFMEAGQGNIYRVDEMQLEKKPNATPFTSSTRTGIINDYSLNNNDRTLQLSTSPSWTSNAIIGKGAYSFDGIDDAINLGAVSENIIRQGKENNDFTLSAWIKPTEIPSDIRIILARAGYHDGLQWDVDGKIHFDLWDGNNGSYHIISKQLDLNVNHYIVGTYSNRIMSLYVDGILMGTNNYYSDNPTALFRSNTNPLALGVFKGTIDDVYVYSRALSAAEIKYNYDVLK